MSSSRPRLVDSTVAAMHLRTAHGVAITAAAVRQWGTRGHLTRHDGTAHFDLTEVVAHARTRGLIPGATAARTPAG